MRQAIPVKPGPDQESVWAYPRPPRLDPTTKVIRIECRGIPIAESTAAIRVLETGHPPVYYIPPEDVRLDLIVPELPTTFCEWKGTAHYYGLKIGERTLSTVAWCYPEASPGFEAIERYLAFYPGQMDHCTVNGVEVVAQPGDFYGGWITPDVAGPFKGDPGTERW